MRAPRRLDPDRVAEELPHLYRAARAWTASREEAEDLVQETCARVLARPRLLYAQDERGYLLRAMHNVLVSQYRAAGRRPVTVPLDDDAPLPRRPTPSRRRPPNATRSSRRSPSCPTSFATPSSPSTSSASPTARRRAALQVAEGTVTSRLSRARDRLARRLGGEE